MVTVIGDISVHQTWFPLSCEAGYGEHYFVLHRWKNVLHLWMREEDLANLLKLVV